MSASVRCSICGGLVSKRSTLLVAPYGRVCRSHPEVEKHKEALAAIAAAEQSDRKLSALAIAEGVRTMAFVKGVSLKFALFTVAWKLPKDIRADVAILVNERGPLTQKEFDDALAMTTLLTDGGEL